MFDGDLTHHPEASLFGGDAAKDPGTIKFNHALHLTKGLTLVTNGLPIKTVNDLSAADRNRYRSPDVGDTEGILLRCNSCHVLDAAGFPNPSGRDDNDLMRIPRGGGSYMLPIRYEAQCRACHPLDFDPKMPPVPHGKHTCGASQDLVRDAYAGQYMEQHPKLAASRPLSSPLPGREEEPEIRQAREWIEKNVATAERVLFSDKRCGECHDIAQPTPSAEHDVVVKGKIPALWFPKAAFDHSAHRAVGCRDCHARAYPDDPKASVVSADVMIPRPWLPASGNAAAPGLRRPGRANRRSGYALHRVPSLSQRGCAARGARSHGARCRGGVDCLGAFFGVSRRLRTARDSRTRLIPTSIAQKKGSTMFKRMLLVAIGLIAPFEAAFFASAQDKAASDGKKTDPPRIKYEAEEGVPKDKPGEKRRDYAVLEAALNDIVDPNNPEYGGCIDGDVRTLRDCDRR